MALSCHSPVGLEVQVLCPLCGGVLWWDCESRRPAWRCCSCGASGDWAGDWLRVDLAGRPALRFCVWDCVPPVFPPVDAVDLLVDGGGPRPVCSSRGIMIGECWVDALGVVVARPRVGVDVCLGVDEWSGARDVLSWLASGPGAFPRGSFVG